MAQRGRMKTVTDRKIIESIYTQYEACFSLRPSALLVREYERGEIINDPLRPLEEFLIVTSGTVSIYDITDDGSVRYVAESGRGTLLGDMEFSRSGSRTFYTEAVGDVVCLSVPFRENLSSLERDPVFLRFVISELGRKLSLNAVIDVTSGPLEEKLLTYLENIAPSHEMKSVDSTMRILHSSRRQLQRVIVKLTQEGKLVKTGRGRYRLNG